MPSADPNAIASEVSTTFIMLKIPLPCRGANSQRPESYLAKCPLSSHGPRAVVEELKGPFYPENRMEVNALTENKSEYIYCLTQWR